MIHREYRNERGEKRRKNLCSLVAFQSCTISSIKKIFNFSGNTCRIIDVLSCPGLLPFWLSILARDGAEANRKLPAAYYYLPPPRIDFKHIFHDAATLNTVIQIIPIAKSISLSLHPNPPPHPMSNFPITFMRRALTLPETIFRLNCNSWNSWHLKGVSNEQTFFSHYRKLFGYLWKTRDISPLIPVLGRCFNFFPDTRTELSAATAPFPCRLSAVSNVSLL